MTKTPFIAAVAILTFTTALISPPSPVYALGGSSATLAVTYGSTATVCGILAGTPHQEIQCWATGRESPRAVYPNISFDAVAGGLDVLCGVRSGGYSVICWDPNFTPKRLYSNPSTPISAISIGDTQICGVTNGSGQNVVCWRGDPFPAQQSNGSSEIVSLSSGLGFSCGVLKSSNRVVCWGEDDDDDKASAIESEFKNEPMVNIQTGGSFACGLNTTGFVVCKGKNLNGELGVPLNSPYAYSGLSLGANHSCAIRKLNHTVICWGGNGEFSSPKVENISFESIVSGLDFTCGLKTSDFSVICWGPGWPSNDELPLPQILPGPCVESNCSECGVYPQSQSLCSGNGNICRPCDLSIPTLPPPPAAAPPTQDSKGLRRGLLASVIAGSVGAFSGLCTLLYCLCVCLQKQKIHNSVQPTIQKSSSSPISRSSTLKRQGSRLMRRQKSGTSSKQHTEMAVEFMFSDLVAATSCFSLENKIGAGSFGVVYKGKLPDGREVAIKRGETGAKAKRFQENESAFESELAFMSRLHHKHLVRLVGFCEENDERLLVYEFMKNGALYDHLHDRNNVEKSCSVLNSWKLRIKIALDAARGIEYLHSYAVPPIIHRDIKSSNILIDADWTGRVADFGLSLMGPEGSRDYSRPVKAAGTVGYIDPEYYGLNILTAKSDVYGLGVVLLELLTGKRAIFKNSDNDNGGVAPMSVVEYAVPAIMAGELEKILDGRVGRPETAEAEAVELVAYTAMLCVNLEGKDRPTMTDIIANLERALGLCDDSHGCLSSDEISIISE